MHDAQQTTISLDIAFAAVRDVLPPKRRDRVELTPETRFEDDLGFSSLEVGEVFVRLEELAGQRLDTSRIEHTKTIADLLEIEPAEEERAW